MSVKTLLRTRESFTLIELLIVVGVVGLLSIIVLLVLNPAEMTKSARDSNRLNDFETINKAIKLHQVDQPSAYQGSSSVVYVSVPDDNINCSNIELPSLPGGWSYHCSPSSTFRKIDGTGWIPIKLDDISYGNPLGTWPVDPINSVSSSYYYTYVKGWELNAKIESKKYKETQLSDGGDDDALFEVGPELALAPPRSAVPTFVTQTDNGATISGFNLSGAAFNQTQVTSTGTNASVWLSIAGKKWGLSTVDSGPWVGKYTSIIYGSDDLARMSYIDEVNNSLKFARCLNQECTSSVIKSIDAGSQAQYTSLVLDSSGFARISYYSSSTGDLMYARCSDQNCNSVSTTSIDSIGTVGQYTSLALDTNGYPRISYYDYTNGDLKYVSCQDASCSSKSIVPVDTTGNVGLFTSIALDSSGYPRISYIASSTPNRIKLALCSDALCSSPNVLFMDSPVVQHYTSIALTLSDLVRIGYYFNTSQKLKYAYCVDTGCTSTSTVDIDNPSNDVGRYTSLALDSNDLARFSYKNESMVNLRHAECSDAACSTPNITEFNVAGNQGDYSDIALDGNDLEGISNYTTNAPGSLLLRYRYFYHNLTGTYESGYIDLGGGVDSWGNVSWNSGGNGTTTIKVRSDLDGNFADASPWGTCTAINNNSPITDGGCVTAGDQFIQYQATLVTSDEKITPYLKDITIGYSI